MSPTSAPALRGLACEVRALLIRFEDLQEHRETARLLGHLRGLVADAEALLREHEAQLLARFPATGAHAR